MGTFYPIFGVPRTGTSLIAQILHTLGVPMSAEQWVDVPDREWTPTHFWADKEFNYLHNRMLINVDDAKINYGMEIPHPEYLTPYEELVQKRETNNPVSWGLKDHWLPILWKTLAPLHSFEIRPLFTFRPAESIHKSYSTRKKSSPQEAEERLIPWVNAVATVQRLYPNALVIPFQKLVAQPRIWISNIAAYVDRPLTEEAITCVRTEWLRF